MCAVLLVMWWMLMTLYVTCVCIYIPIYSPERNVIYGIYGEYGPICYLFRTLHNFYSPERREDERLPVTAYVIFMDDPCRQFS